MQVVVEAEAREADYPPRADLKGKSGETIAPFSPSGIVEIDGRHYEAVMEDVVLAGKSGIDVVRVEGKRLVVRPREEKKE